MIGTRPSALMAAIWSGVAKSMCSRRARASTTLGSAAWIDWKALTIMASDLVLREQERVQVGLLPEQDLGVVEVGEDLEPRHAHVGADDLALSIRVEVIAAERAPAGGL